MLRNRSYRAVIFLLSLGLGACSAGAGSSLPASAVRSLLSAPASPAVSTTERAASDTLLREPYRYIAPWGGFASGTEAILNPQGNCGHIPATVAPGYSWPAMLALLPVGKMVTVFGTPSYDNQWSIQNGCPTGGIKVTLIVAGIVTTPPTPTPTPTPAPTPTAPPSSRDLLLPQAGTIYLGARVNPNPIIHPYEQARVAPFEAQIGRKLALDDQYYAWNAPFPGTNEANDYANNRIPVIAWNCQYSNASVAAGAHDTDIIATAQNIKKYGHPIFLRWFWEMNLVDTADFRSTCWDPATDEPGGMFSPINFVAAWKHIRSVFAAQHVSNVVWLWDPSASEASNTAFAAFYPGNSEVDWMGFDAYAITNGETAAQTWGDTYAKLTALSSKPIVITETATIAPNQPFWLSGAENVLATQYPNIKGVMYFDTSGARADWSLIPTGTPSGLGVFRTFANTPYLAGQTPASAHGAP